MWKQIIRSVLRNEAGDTSDGSEGGTSEANGIARPETGAADGGMLSGLKKFRKGQDGSDGQADNGDQTGSGGEGDQSDVHADDANRAKAEADLDFDLDYEGILGASTQNIGDGEGEESDADGGQEVSEGESKDSEDSEDSSEDGQSDEVDVESLTTSDGKPISKEAKQAFADLKAKLKDAQDQLTEREEILKKSKPEEDYQKLEEEHNKLKQQLDIIDFTRSEDFTEKYQKPIDKAIADSTKWLTEIPESETNAAKSILQQANAALGSGKEGAFFDAVDQMMENHLSGTKGARFAASMNKLWDANTAKMEAEGNAIEARKSILEDRQKRAQTSDKVISSTIESSLGTISQQNENVFNFYRSDAVKDKFNLDKNLKEGTEQAKGLLKQFLSTGAVPAQLTEMLINGALTPVRNTEREVVMASLNNYQKKLAITEKENQALQAKLKKMTTKRGSLNDSGADDDDSEDSGEPGYGLLSGLKNLRNA